MLNFSSVRRQNQWLLLLLVFVVLLPSATVLWLTGVAVRNQRAAMAQQISAVYQSQAEIARGRIDSQWNEIIERCQVCAEQFSGAELYRECIEQGLCDTAFVFSRRGELTYPNFDPPDEIRSINPKAWRAAERLEFVENQPGVAAEAYAAIAEYESDSNAAIAAWLAHARCLVKSHKVDVAIDVLSVRSESDETTKDDTRSRHQRNSVVDAKLRAIELLIENFPGDQRIEPKQKELAVFLADYSNPIPASQRLSVLNQLGELGDRVCTLLAAEELADAFWSEQISDVEKTGMWWQLSRSQRCVPIASAGLILVFDGDGLANRFRQTLQPLQNANLTFTVADADGFVTKDSDVAIVDLKSLPNRKLVLSARDTDLLAESSRVQTMLYVWAGLLTIIAAAVLALLISVVVRRQLRTAQVKSDLVAFVSHELRTPIASVRVLLDTLMQGADDDPERTREYLQLIAGENERLSRLVNNFLTFSKLQRNSNPFYMQNVAVSDVVSGATRAMGERLTEPDTKFTLGIDDDVASIRTDRDAIVTVILNLLDNAHKFTTVPREIDLRVHRDEEFVVFEVADNGIGMTSRQTKRIFDHHYQADMRLSRNHGGCGLGLSLVRDIVAAHGGSVDVRSMPENGSLFSVRIPVGTGQSDGRDGANHAELELSVASKDSSS